MPERPLRILVYSDNPRTREQVKLALGKRVHPDLPELTYLEVATGPMVIRQMDEGGFDLVILDGEATPTGGMGIAKQLKDEIADCPPILVLTGRPRRPPSRTRSTRSSWATPWCLCCAPPCSSPLRQSRCCPCLFEARQHGRRQLIATLIKMRGTRLKAR